MNVTNATSTLVNATTGYAFSTVLVEKGMLAVLLVVEVASVLSLLAMVALLATQLARLERLLRAATGTEAQSGLLGKSSSRWCKKRRSTKTDPNDTAVSASRDIDEVRCRLALPRAPPDVHHAAPGRTVRKRGRGGR